MKIGVLDIQGSVEEHFSALAKVPGITPVLVKKISDLDGVRGLIIPGGESTTIGKLLRRFGLRDEIIRRATTGKEKDRLAIWGTCAGAILIAKKIVGRENADTMALMNITVERNAYGRQVDSFETEVKFDGKTMPAVFIRAPKIISVGKEVSFLAKYNEEIVAARERKLLVTTFHPEMTESTKAHEYFAKICR